ncbi:MAG: glycosyltransferase family 39 protein [Crocinitomicaceae bacterium]
MKSKLSLIAVILISLIYFQFRFSYTDFQKGDPLKVTTWDAFGYYMYLPGMIIYNDVTELKWVPEIEKEYQLTGGYLYQADAVANGNYVFKYLGGVAIMQTPFFLIGHTIASFSDYKADGFSAPYQYSIALGAIVYFMLALYLLRNILLRYFSDRATAITLLYLTLATNLIQYISIDGAQSHAFIFPLYVLILYATIKWHESPKVKCAALIGLIIGLATISRPTEAIMLFIPLLWETQTKESKKLKWQKVKLHLKHIWVVILFAIIGALPQLIYWKITSGSFVYDVGSKWFFLNPWFRVLFGFENGWFIYTPITIFFVLGFFFMKNLVFKKSVIVFCLLNIWIIIAWSDYKYGATFSTRAMVQSYPVFALAFGALIHRIEQRKWKYAFYVVGLYLIAVNFFQIGQYNTNVIHYKGMNALYYSRIYLDSAPTPLDMSLLDTDEILDDVSNFKKKKLSSSTELQKLTISPNLPAVISETTIGKGKKGWVKIEANLKATDGFNSANLHGKILSGIEVKEILFRARNPICIANQNNRYEFFVKVPYSTEEASVIFLITSGEEFNTTLKSYSVSYLEEK